MDSRPSLCSTCLEESPRAGAEPGPPTPAQGHGGSLGSGSGMPWAKRLGLRAVWEVGPREQWPESGHPGLERGFLEVMSSLTVRRSPGLSAHGPHGCWPQTGWLCLPALLFCPFTEHVSPGLPVCPSLFLTHIMHSFKLEVFDLIFGLVWDLAQRWRYTPNPSGREQSKEARQCGRPGKSWPWLHWIVTADLMSVVRHWRHGKTRE